MNATTSTAVAQQMELRDQLEARAGEFANALPSHIRPEYFQRATLTAIAQNPQLLAVDRRSLFNALMRCAQDGLIPDGRQAALVIFKDRDRGPIAQYMPMVAGVRHLVQQSGEITRFEQVVVHANDKFDYRLGDLPRINHVPAMADRGPPILVYSIAQFRDGTLSRDVMTVEEVEKVRGVSRAKDSGPWREWWSEMAKKTIAKRHAKVLPMSNDAATALARDDQDNTTLPAPGPQLVDFAPAGRPRLAQQLDALSQPSAEQQSTRKRGRPRKGKTAAEDEHDLPDELEAVDTGPVEFVDSPETQLGFGEPDDHWPGPRPDFDQGQKDAEAGHAGCLNRDIRENPDRLKEWQRGYNSVPASKRRPA